MENFELQQIWKSIDNKINFKSKDELNLLLKSKAKQTLNKFIIVLSTSIFSAVGLIIFLIVTALNRPDDLLYLINNATLGILTLVSLVSGITSWYRIQKSEFGLSIKDWLKERITIISHWLSGKSGKIYLYVIPVFYILTILSIHVYYEYKPYVEVFNSQDSVMGLIVAAPIGIFVSIFFVRKIRKYQLQNLEFLKDMYSRLCNE